MVATAVASISAALAGLLCVGGLVVAAGALVAALLYARRTPDPPAADPSPVQAPGRPSLGGQPDRPRSFGYKCFWFAAPVDGAGTLGDALGLADAVASPWANGIERAYGGGACFVTPCVDGWVFALGAGRPAMNTRPEDWIEQVRAASGRLGGELQFFLSDRAGSSYGWVRARNGRIHRAFFADAAGPAVDAGATTVEERNALGLLGDTTAFDDDEPDQQLASVANEDFVLGLAADWSLNPTTLEARGLGLDPDLGLLAPWPDSPNRNG